MKQNKEIDFHNRKEILVQTAQALFHFVMSAVIMFGTPTEYLQDPMAQTVDHLYNIHIKGENSSNLFGVNLVYLIVSVYNTLLYFWDPLSNRPIRLYHMMALLIGPLLLVYDHLSYLSCMMLAIYLMDLTETLLQYKYAAQFDKRRMLLGLIKFHHMVTLMLIGFSWVYGYVPIGIFILFIHDVTDVPMFVVRILRKKNAPESKQFLVAGIVIALWVYYRVISMLDILISVYNIVFVQTLHVIPDQISAYACFYGLCALWSLNVYWTSLVIVKAGKVLMGHETEKDDE